MRVVVALLLVIHGLIHLLGFLKAWKLADIPQLTGATLFPIPGPLHGVVGGLWLLTCLILVGAAPLILFRYGPWWIIAAIGVAVSQLLVIYAWPDAKAGTVLNIVLFIIVMFAWADARFQSDTDEQVLALFSKPSTTPSSFVNSEDLEKLPAPVRRWLEGSGVVGKQVIRTVRLKQRGQMRNSQGKGSMPATAHQYFRVDEPKFIWRVCVRMMHILPIAGRDSYSDGQGRMLIKVASLIPVVDADDEKIDQGALLRFLGEIVWFPAAALRPYIHWESINETSAKATMTYRGVSGSAVFMFDGRGRFSNLSADRYFGGGPDARIEHWSISAKDWKVMDGVLVPVKGEVVWKLKEGDFTFYRWEVTELEYDPSGLFATE